MSAEDDRDLARLFREVRADDERHTPSFASMLEPHRAPRRRLLPTARLAIAVAAGVALAAAGVWRLATPNAPTTVIAFTPGDMRVPTDYLLDLATYSRAGEIPRIGDADWYPVPLASDASPDTRRRP